MEQSRDPYVCRSVNIRYTQDVPTETTTFSRAPSMIPETIFFVAFCESKTLDLG